MFGGVALAVLIHDDGVPGTDRRGDDAHAHTVVANRGGEDDAGRGLARLHHAGADVETHADAVAFVEGRAVEGPAFDARAFQEGLAHGLVVFVAARAENDGLAGLVGNGLAALFGDDADHFALVVLNELAAAGFIVDRDLVLAVFHARRQALPEGFALRRFFLGLSPGGLVLRADAVRIRSAVNLIAAFLGAREVGEGRALEARRRKRLELRVDRLHPVQETRRIVGPGLSETVGHFGLFAFELAGNVLAREHGLGVFLQGLAIARLVRAMENAARHTGVGAQRVLGLTFDDDDGSTVVGRRNGSRSARAAETDDDNVRLLVKLHFLGGSRAREARAHHAERTGSGALQKLATIAHVFLSFGFEKRSNEESARSGASPSVRDIFSVRRERLSIHRAKGH